MALDTVPTCTIVQELNWSASGRLSCAVLGEPGSFLVVVVLIFCKVARLFAHRGAGEGGNDQEDADAESEESEHRCLDHVLSIEGVFANHK